MTYTVHIFFVVQECLCCWFNLRVHTPSRSVFLLASTGSPRAGGSALAPHLSSVLWVTDPAGNGRHHPHCQGQARSVPPVRWRGMDKERGSSAGKCKSKV